MDSPTAWVGLATLLLVLGGYISIIYFFSPKYDPREPPGLSHFIPYVGHILGLITYGQRYFESLSAKNPHLPIFTLQTLNKRTYIVSSADLVASVERNQKTISFFPFVSAMSPRLFNIPRHGRAMDIIDQNIDRANGDWGLVHETSQGMHAVLTPGSNLDRMNRCMLGIMARSFDELAEVEKPIIGLYEWSKPKFTVASTEAIYGPGNPFKLEPELGNDFWEFDRNLTKILLGVFPSVLAAKGWQARRRLIDAINAYFARGDDKDGLGVLKIRRDAGTKYGATIDDISRFEMGDIIGVLVNAVPTLFWTLCHIYSDSALLEDIRTEISAFMHTEPAPFFSKKHTLDITTLQDSCPLLVSTYKEILRTRSESSTSRWVTEDTLLGSKYLLKKDSVLLIPSALIHADPVWGPDAKEFNPRRFMGKSDMKAGANRTWGGGQTLCPGRFFATMEITCSVAMIVARFDLEPIDDGGKWVIPERDTNSIASSIHPPKTDVRVKVREREIYRGDQWAFKFAEETT